MKENEGKFGFGALVVKSDLGEKLPPHFEKCGGWLGNSLGDCPHWRNVIENWINAAFYCGL